MRTQTIKRFNYLVETIPEKLSAIPAEEFSKKPLPEKWSKKEILGHLVDSAANNLQRFVRIQFEDNPLVNYRQDDWNKHSYHQLADQNELIEIWIAFNKHLLFIAKNIPSVLLERTGKSDDSTTATLSWLIDDYIVHMEHHLKQIVTYK